jgi:maleamate amidohydrolase
VPAVVGSVWATVMSAFHTVEDAIAEGFRPIIVKEAVGDRVPGVVAWNLFDMDSKFVDVEPLENVIV